MRKSRRTRWGQSASEAVTDGRGEQEEAPPLKPADVAARAAAARAAVEKAKKALALQKQIQEQIAAMRGIMGSRGAHAVMTTGVSAALRGTSTFKQLRFDRLGREIDAEGKVIEVKRLARSTLKVNINKQREAKLKQASFHTRVDRGLVNPTTNPWFDPSLPSASKVRKKGLSFVERGFYTKKERLLRTRELAQSMGLKMLTPEAREEQKRRDAAAEAALKRVLRRTAATREEEPSIEEAPEEENPNLIALGKRRDIVEEEELEEAEEEEEWTVYRQEALHLLQRKQVGIIPDVEWWDQPLLKKQPDGDVEDADFPYVIVESTINDLVEHPVPLAPVVDITKPIPPSLYLTPKERAKLRRRKRQEKEKDKRDKIRMGLMAPPPPRVKLANLARVLGTSAAADPSKIEKGVREQVAQRQREHEERNEARKLDPEARRKKNIGKWTKMPGEAEIPVGGAEVCVFSVASLADGAQLYKVDKNAQQFHVTGACIICPQIGNLIIVEGSPKALKGYKKLLLRRIKWDVVSDDGVAKPFEDAAGTSTEGAAEGDASRYCRLLWQGAVKDRAFKQWKVYPCKSEAEVKKILSDRNSEHYWEMLKKLRLAGGP